MKGKVLKRLREVVDDHNDDYEDLVELMYSELEGKPGEGISIEANNLLISGIIRKFEGLKIMSG